MLSLAALPTGDKGLEAGLMCPGIGSGEGDRKRQKALVQPWFQSKEVQSLLVDLSSPWNGMDQMPSRSPHLAFTQWCVGQGRLTAVLPKVLPSSVETQQAASHETGLLGELKPTEFSSHGGEEESAFACANPQEASCVGPAVVWDLWACPQVAKNSRDNWHQFCPGHGPAHTPYGLPGGEIPFLVVSLSPASEAADGKTELN